MSRIKLQKYNDAVDSYQYLSLSEIAKNLSVSKNAVWKALKRRNVKMTDSVTTNHTDESLLMKEQIRQAFDEYKTHLNNELTKKVEYLAKFEEFKTQTSDISNSMEESKKLRQDREELVKSLTVEYFNKFGKVVDIESLGIRKETVIEYNDNVADWCIKNFSALVTIETSKIVDFKLLDEMVKKDPEKFKDIATVKKIPKTTISKTKK